MKQYDLQAVNERTLSMKEFVDLSDAARKRLVFVRFLAPRLGSKKHRWGAVKVKMDAPVYQVKD